MNNPKAYYQYVLDDAAKELSRLKKLSLLFSLLRLSVFIAVVLTIYYSGRNQTIIASALGGGIALFLFLVARSTDIRNKKNYTEKLVGLNEKELRALDRDFSGFSGGEEFLDSDHFYNRDIDLFGEGTLFPRVNRTALKDGKKFLANLFNSNDIGNIPEKQKAIKELSEYADWRQEFHVNASLVENEEESHLITDWLSSYQPKIPKFFSYFTIAFSLVSLGLAVLFGFDIISWGILVAWFFLGLGISSVFFGKVTELYTRAGKMKDIFAQYSKLLYMIEKKHFDSKILKEEQERIGTEGENASVIFQKVAKEINSLDQRNNILFALAANGFLLWDIRYARRVEKWIDEFEETTEHWFEAAAFFDAYNSLGNYSFNHPNLVFPQVDYDSDNILNAEAIGHPLIDPDMRVDNDIMITRESFFIITGANMAGKSTFLRTVSLGIVMSNMGLPVCAGKMSYSPIRLITSMKTSDSLLDDSSYFFAELTRLKFITEAIEKDRYFIVLDEILKGTNSKDKEEGSKKFVARLVRSKSTGIIATHDLGLCELEKQYPVIENHYFDAEIINDELYFDYKMKEGICKNMNASFLLRKMGIVEG